MDKLESVIFAAVLFFAVGGLMYMFTSGAGEATRMLKGCKGGDIMQLTFTGLNPNTIGEYQFRGLTGSIELLDIKDGKARFSVDGQYTPYLGFGDVWLGEQIGIKMSELSKRDVSFCLASTVPECSEYIWNIDSKQRECRRWASQADMMFE